VYGIYGHMASPPPVTEGACVTAGSTIGTEGATGHATGPHLHWAIKDSDTDWPGYPKDDPDGHGFRDPSALVGSTAYRALCDTSSSASQVFAYDRTSTLRPGRAHWRIYDLSPAGTISTIGTGDSMRPDWELMIPIDIDADGSTEVFAYDRTSTLRPGRAHWRIYDLSPAGTISTIGTGDSMRPDWELMIPIDIDGPMSAP
jgi:murein DD-endopeptidase MepM/ murein hydrolase activator NlpD